MEMEKSFLTPVRGAYEPPYADIFEFVVERGFNLSGVDNDGYGTNDGMEMPDREDVENPWG